MSSANVCSCQYFPEGPKKSRMQQLHTLFVKNTNCVLKYYVDINQKLHIGQCAQQPQVSSVGKLKKGFYSYR
jgi:hypothetical protein